MGMQRTAFDDAEIPGLCCSVGRTGFYEEGTTCFRKNVVIIYYSNEDFIRLNVFFQKEKYGGQKDFAKCRYDMLPFRE